MILPNQRLMSLVSGKFGVSHKQDTTNLGQLSLHLITIYHRLLSADWQDLNANQRPIPPGWYESGPMGNQLLGARSHCSLNELPHDWKDPNLWRKPVQMVDPKYYPDRYNNKLIKRMTFIRHSMIMFQYKSSMSTSPFCVNVQVCPTWLWCIQGGNGK